MMLQTFLEGLPENFTLDLNGARVCVCVCVRMCQRLLFQFLSFEGRIHLWFSHALLKPLLPRRSRHTSFRPRCVSIAHITFLLDL
jgi:hypothetical protein